MGFLGFFDAADRNAENRSAEYGDWNKYTAAYDARDKINREQYAEAERKYEADIVNNEDNLRRTEKERIQKYQSEVDIQNFQFDQAGRAYDKSVEQAETQKEFNRIAQRASLFEQNAKKNDDLLAVMFDENDTLLEHSFASTGLRVDRQNKLAAASFQEARFTAKNTADTGLYDIERRKARSESRIETQKAIIEGMKAAGTVRARGNTGRTAAKGALAVMAESGALRASIANGLMYAEQGIDLNIAQLRDMLILDQTMVLAARNTANNEFTIKDNKLDASLAADTMKLSASRDSIRARDKIVRQNIFNARRQADMAAEAQVLLQPERMPAPVDPREFYKEYDDPETEDYLELFKRPEIYPFPEYVPEPKLDFEKDFHYSRGRENVASSNFGDVLKIGGLAAGAVSGIGALAGGGLFGGAAATSFLGKTGFLANSAATFGTISTGLNSAASNFYPQYQRQR